MLYWRFPQSAYTYLSIRNAGYRTLPVMVRNFHDGDEIKKRLEQIIKNANNTASTKAGQQKATDSESNAFKTFKEIYNMRYKENANDATDNKSAHLEESNIKLEARQVPTQSQVEDINPSRVKSNELSLENRVKAFVALKDAVSKPVESQSDNNDSKSNVDQDSPNISESTRNLKSPIKSPTDKADSATVESSHPTQDAFKKVPKTTHLKISPATQVKAETKQYFWSQDKKQSHSDQAKVVYTIPSQVENELSDPKELFVVRRKQSKNDIQSIKANKATEINDLTDNKSFWDKSKLMQDQSEVSAAHFDTERFSKALEAMILRNSNKVEEVSSKPTHSQHHSENKSAAIETVKAQKNELNQNTVGSVVEEIRSLIEADKKHDVNTIKVVSRVIDESSQASDKVLSSDAIGKYGKISIKSWLENGEDDRKSEVFRVEKPSIWLESANNITTQPPLRGSIKSLLEQEVTEVNSDKSSAKVTLIEHASSSQSPTASATASISEDLLMSMTFNKASLLKSEEYKYFNKAGIHVKPTLPGRSDKKKSSTSNNAIVTDGTPEAQIASDLKTPQLLDNSDEKKSSTSHMEVETGGPSEPQIGSNVKTPTLLATSDEKKSSTSHIKGETNGTPDAQISSDVKRPTLLASSDGKKSSTSHTKNEIDGTPQTQISFDLKTNVDRSELSSPSGKAFKVKDNSAEIKIKSESNLTPGDLYSSSSECESRYENETPKTKYNQEYTKKKSLMIKKKDKSSEKEIKSKKAKRNPARKPIELKQAARKSAESKFQGDLKSHNNRISTSEREDQTRLTSYPEKTKAPTFKTKENEIHLKKQATSSVRKEVIRKPSTLLDYLYNFFRGHRSMTTYSLSPNLEKREPDAEANHKE
ncbi:muscle M-line assembly protein unc-89-like [Drosophila grimshawi]|uniref:muscle M-line assembly protein unc-89-like n=1 Tax=Drosophila grimshawi TaxID=7222 RepID=UPI000C86FD05|nr:muscle M-line assembly protein unc-89-like [Drosophila grimshawi]